MKNKSDEIVRKNRLRQRAEQELQKNPQAAAGLTTLEFTKLTHELSVHQIELEMQNDELRRAQAEVEGSRQRLSDLFDFAPVGYFVLDEQGSILDVNLAGAALLSEDRVAVIGKLFSNFINREDQDDYFLFRKKMGNLGGGHDLELRLEKKNAGPLYVLLKGTAAEEPATGKVWCRITATDINGRIIAEKELHRHKNHLEELVRERTSQIENKNTQLKEYIAVCKRAGDALRIKDWAIESATNAIATSDMEGNLNYVNPSFLRMWGYGTSAEILGKPAAEFWKMGEKAAELPEAAVTKGNWSGELTARRKDGSPFDVYVSSSAVTDDAGRSICFMTSFEDITMRKKLDDARNFLLQYSFQRSGEKFFNSLARYLAHSLGMEYVCIDQLVGDGLTARTLAVYNDGSFESNAEYALKDTPCGAAVGKSVCCFRKNVCLLFPNDAALRDLKAECYVGATLWSYNESPIGLIAVIGRRRLANPEVAEEILKLVTIRAAGELERKLAEEDLKNRADDLKVINEDLTRFNTAMVDREIRMIELKKQVNELSIKLGQTQRYTLDFADNEDIRMR